MKRAYESVTMKKKVRAQASACKYNINPEFVLMPWDDKNTIIISGDGRAPQVYSRWELIQKLLRSSEIYSVGALISTIKSYNVVFNENGEQVLPDWNFLVLFNYFAQLNEFERNEFFQENGILSTIRKLSLQLKESVPSIKVLKAGLKSSNTLHQLQIASILANAFFCTFPKGTADCPSINFNTLFEGASSSVSKYYLEKIKCLIHYFKRIHQKQPSGFLSFHRLNIPDHKFPRWDKTDSLLSSLKVDFEGRIEDQVGYLQMDFANKYVGGGVLGRGCVQEEIRFLICPELIAARLFTECLGDNESLFVVGAERYCQYSGYSNTFEFAGDYIDTTPFDENRHRKTYVIVLDALYFHHSSEQYRESKILRELKKAYVGFKSLEMFKTLPLATGNWGCGSFGGDPQLKSLLQIMASSEARRDVLYLTFGNSLLKNQIEELYLELRKNAITVGALYCILRTYYRTRERNQTVFEFVMCSIRRPEKGKFPPKCVPSTSQKAIGTMSLSDVKEEPSSNYFPDMEVDFDELDKEVQKHLSPQLQIPAEKQTTSLFCFNCIERCITLFGSDYLDYMKYLGKCKCHENKKADPTLEKYTERRNLSPDMFTLGEPEERPSDDKNASPVFHLKSVRNSPKSENSTVNSSSMSLCEYMSYLNEMECQKNKVVAPGIEQERHPNHQENSPKILSNCENKDVGAISTKNVSFAADTKRLFPNIEKGKKIKKLTQTKITSCFLKK